MSINRSLIILNRREHLSWGFTMLLLYCTRKREKGFLVTCNTLKRESVDTVEKAEACRKRLHSNAITYITFVVLVGEIRLASTEEIGLVVVVVVVDVVVVVVVVVIVISAIAVKLE